MSTPIVAGDLNSFTDLSRQKDDRRKDPRLDMRDEKIIWQGLEQLRVQFLQWGTPDLRVFVITKDELRGWIRALEWVLVGHAEQTLKD